MKSSGVEFSELTLRVRDLRRAEEFYHRILGFNTVVRTETRALLSPSGKGPALVALESAPDAARRQTDSAGLFHVAFLYPTRAALGGLLRHLVNADVRFGAGDHGVSEALYLSDPEGNGIELYADRPESGWPTLADGSISMVSEPVNLNSLFEAGGKEDIPSAMANARIGHLHLAVSDLNRAESLYSGALGFSVRQRSYPGALFLARDGYHHHLGLNNWQSKRHASSSATGLMSFHVKIGRNPSETATKTCSAETPTPHQEVLHLNDPDGWELIISAA